MLIFEKYDFKKQNLRPEVADGFDYSVRPTYQTTQTVRHPVSFFVKAEPGQNYTVNVTLIAQKDIKKLLLFTGRKQLRAILSLKTGERRSFSFYQSLTEIIPDFSQDKLTMDTLFVSYCTADPDAITLKATAEKVACRKIFLCGDSTVTDQVAPSDYYPEMAYTSWGQSLPAFISSQIAIDNQAHSGNTTESFREEGHWDIVKKWLRPADFCLFQFGHNDQKIAHLLPDRDYRKNIKRYVKEVRDLGAQPILVTPMGRNTWKKADYNDLLTDYALEIKDLGQTLQVPVLDLHADSIALWQLLGQKRATDFFPKGDYTHTNEYGSYLIAKIIAGKLQQLDSEIFELNPGSPDFLPNENRWTDFHLLDVVANEQRDGSAALHTMESAVDALTRTIEQVKKEEKE